MQSDGEDERNLHDDYRRKQVRIPPPRPMRAVLSQLLARRGYKKLPLKRYNYGVRICPEPVHWGGLSGSTYTEAVSWGKFVPPEEGGKFAEVFEDATVALPLVAGAVLERIGYFKR